MGPAQPLFWSSRNGLKIELPSGASQSSLCTHAMVEGSKGEVNEPEIGDTSATAVVTCGWRIVWYGSDIIVHTQRFRLRSPDGGRLGNTQL